MLGLVGRLNKTTVSSQYHQVKYLLNLYPYLRYISHRHQWGWITTSIKRNKSLRKKSFNWTISTQYTQRYYHLFQTFNMPWRKGTARILRGLPMQISRLIRTTYGLKPCVTQSPGFSIGSFLNLVFSQLGLFSILSFLNLVFSQSGLFSILSFLNLVFSQSGLFSILSFLNWIFLGSPPPTRW